MPDVQTDAVQQQGARVVELFGAVGADPDDPVAAREADEALWRLDELLAGE